MTIVRRISSGELYEASHPDDFNGLLDDPACYYFRHVIPSGKRWWQFWRPKFVRTGCVWETNDEALFEIVDDHERMD